MLTKVITKNFKRFDHAEIELGNPVVFIGPNNSGKTSILQALSLWDIGLKKWLENKRGKSSSQRSGVTINRNALLSLPVPQANQLWRELHVRNVSQSESSRVTKNIRIDIIVEGVDNGHSWQCGMEFDYANPESLYCRPLRLSEESNPGRMTIPDDAGTTSIAFLPPMSGLSSNEVRLDSGAINVRIGEGRTAEVLRNLCHIIHENHPDKWQVLQSHIYQLFVSRLDVPHYIPERGELTMEYSENNTTLDISSSGRGLQQTLLLLSYMLTNPNSVILLDEPDAHLEILRQRQIYQVLTDVSRDNNNQIIAASHSEVLLNEAADRDVVIAFVGKPHRIDDQGSQLLKSLREIGFEHYYQAELTGWVLYLEGSTDLAILREFAKLLQRRDALEALDRPFVHYVGNQPNKALEHFHGLREAVKDLRGIAVFDRLERGLPDTFQGKITGYTWTKKEIENYICSRETLLNFARDLEQAESLGPIFESGVVQKRIDIMNESIKEVESALLTLEKGSPWEDDMKVSDDFLPQVFSKFYKKLNLPNIMLKTNFHRLVRYLQPETIDPEINTVLDRIVETAKSVNR